MRTATAALCAALAMGGLGCTKIDNALDCETICNRYKSCYDSSYNDDACYDRCRANSESRDFDRKVDICDACLSGRDCNAAAFNCTDECVGIVP